MNCFSRCPECDSIDITGGFCDDCGTDLNPTDPSDDFEDDFEDEDDYDEEDDEEDNCDDDWVYAEDED